MIHERANRITARVITGVLVETHEFSPSEPLILPPHAHEEYQIGLTVTENGLYRYRGASVPVPRGSVSVLHPGEVHSGRVREERDHVAIFHSIYLPVRVLNEALGLDGRRGPSVFAAAPVVMDDAVFTAALKLHRALLQADTDLAHQVPTLATVRLLMARLGAWRPPEQVADHDGVTRARDLLHDRVGDNVSLDTLADLAGLSVWHFCRVFARRFGLPPHRYQLQLRVMRAKALLADGAPAGEVAALLGFHDARHFARHFKAFTLASPSRYGRS